MKSMLLAGVLAGGLLVSPSRAQSAPAQSVPAAKPAASTSNAKPAAAGSPTRYQPNRFPRRAGAYYGLVWGIDSLSVKAVESGELIRFSYHVLDADKAKELNDKKVEPSLISPQAGVRLVIPSLEKVGQLRQVSTPEAGRSYERPYGRYLAIRERIEKLDLA